MKLFEAQLSTHKEKAREKDLIRYTVGEWYHISVQSYLGNLMARFASKDEEKVEQEVKEWEQNLKSKITTNEQRSSKHIG